ncbi:MAG: phosphate ABC transporter substrate-binding protein PstS [Gaiellaceae bacterium]
MDRRQAVLVFATAVVVSAGCGGSTPAGGEGVLHGAGSTLVLPLVSAWASVYRDSHGVRIDYNGIGSGGGIAAISARQVDFGTSDAPLSPDQSSACGDCVQIPWALSATSVVYNLKGVSAGLRISGPILADIYLGKITSWRDPRLRALNPGVRLPGRRITPIFRTEASGTTYNFTAYLSSVSSAWRSRVGASTGVRFPTGVGASTSSGVTGLLTRTDGAIAYVEVAYTIQGRLSSFRIANAAGRYRAPVLRSIAAAAKTAGALRPGAELSIVNPPASSPLAYPICTFTYVILPRHTGKASALRRFVSWALTKGQPYGPALLFSPLPRALVLADLRRLAALRR